MYLTFQLLFQVISNSPSPWTCFRVCTIYRCRTAAAPCKDRVTVITFGSDVPFVKQSSAWRQVLRLHSRLSYSASLYKRNSFKQHIKKHSKYFQNKFCIHSILFQAVKIYFKNKLCLTITTTAEPYYAYGVQGNLAIKN